MKQKWNLHMTRREASCFFNYYLVSLFLFLMFLLYSFFLILLFGGGTSTNLESPGLNSPVFVNFSCVFHFFFHVLLDKNTIEGDEQLLHFNLSQLAFYHSDCWISITPLSVILKSLVSPCYPVLCTLLQCNNINFSVWGKCCLC